MILESHTTLGSSAQLTFKPTIPSHQRYGEPVMRSPQRSNFAGDDERSGGPKIGQQGDQRDDPIQSIGWQSTTILMPGPRVTPGRSACMR